MTYRMMNALALRPALFLLAPCLVACAQPNKKAPAVSASPSRGTVAPTASRNPRGVPEGLLQARHEVRLGTRCGPRCAYLTSGQSLASLKLAPDGRAEARDEGTLLETFASVAGDSEHLSTWSRSWVGTWDQGEEGLSVRLAPEAAQCRREPSSGESDSSCTPTPLELECTHRTVTLRVDTRGTARALVCEAKGQDPQLAATRLPWVFGVQEPLLAVDFGGSHHPRRAYGLLVGGDKSAQTP